MAERGAADALAVKGRCAEARTSMERLSVEIEKALGPEAVELLEPLDLIAQVTRLSGQLPTPIQSCCAPSQSARSTNGEEGMVTCRHRTQIGELCASPVPRFIFLLTVSHDI